MKPGTLVKHIVTDTEHDKHVGIVIAVDTSERLDGATTVDVWVRWIKPDGSPSDGLTRHAPAELSPTPPDRAEGEK